ncbi:MAG: cytochrome c biogenesis protein ResB [Elusimicrobia bacterium]|nr:cytochrome c biogenesis protein ResB [Elusimicrobiota bacterium]
MIFEIPVLAALVLFMLAGAIPVDGGAQTVIFKTPVFVILAILLGLSLLIRSLRLKFKLRHAPVHAAHLGAILILIGSGVSAIKEVKSSFELPADERYTVSEFAFKDKGIVSLGFSLALKKLEIARDNTGQYKATLRFIIPGSPAVEREMLLNKPASFNGWRFYLTSFDPQSLGYAGITVRRDPGRRIVIVGMLILTLAIAIIFYFGLPENMINRGEK